MYYIITALGILMGLIAGLKYGKVLKQKSLDVDTAFQGKRGWVVLSLFIICCAAFAILLKNPQAMTPEVSVGLNYGIWTMVKVIIIFMSFMAIPLSHTKPKSYPPVLAVFAVICIISTQMLERYMMAPIYPQLKMDRRGTNGEILQSTGVTCTAAAMANAVTHFGLKITEKESAKLVHTRRFGTTDAELQVGIHQLGLYSYNLTSDPLHLSRINRPAVISIWFGGIAHSIAVYDKDEKGNLIYIDPTSGIVKYSNAVLKKKLIDPKLGVIITKEPLPSINSESPENKIKEIQDILLKEHFLNKITGRFDEAMSNGIKNFQKKFNVKATGMIDDLTYLLLTGPYLKENHL